MKILIDSQSRFSELYGSLAPEEQNLLKLISIIYGSVKHSAATKCLNRAGLKNDKGILFQEEDIYLIADRLEQKKLISIDEYNEMSCLPEYIEEATSQAVYDGSFKSLSKAVETMIPISRG